MKKLTILVILGCAIYTCISILLYEFGWFNLPSIIVSYWIFGGLSILNASNILLKPLENASIHDKLTGCHNRVRLSMRIPEYENHSKYAVIFFDINNFKKVNDIHGHDEGDKLLVKVSNVLRFWFTYGDLYRIGGDEFIVVIPNAQLLDLEKIVATWYATVPLLNFEYNDDFKCTLSYGIAYKMGDMSFQEVLGVADEQMYLMKKAIASKNS